MFVDTADNRLLFFVPPSGDDEQIRGHPGCWFEACLIQPSSTLKAITHLEVFALFESSRRLQRRLVFTTDYRLCLKSLSPSVEDRDRPPDHDFRFCAGNFFGGMFTVDGKLERRPGVGSLSSAGVASLTIRRNRTKPPLSQKLDLDNAEAEWRVEEYVEPEALEGLLPDALIQQFYFWRTSPTQLRGYDMQAPAGQQFAFESIVVRFVWDEGAEGAGHRRRCRALVQRLQAMRLESDTPGRLTLKHIDSISSVSDFARKNSGSSSPKKPQLKRSDSLSSNVEAALKHMDSMSSAAQETESGVRHVIDHSTCALTTVILSLLVFIADPPPNCDFSEMQPLGRNEWRDDSGQYDSENWFI